MLRVLLHLGRHPLFSRETPELVYSIRELSSSRAGFVVPDRCETWIDIHLPPEIDPAVVRQEMEKQVEEASAFVDSLEIEMTFTFDSRGYRLDADNWLAGVLEEVYPRLNLPLQHDAFRSHSDGNLFFEAGVKPLILGPGSLETAHTPDEQTTLGQVEDAARIYAALCLAAE